MLFLKLLKMHANIAAARGSTKIARHNIRKNIMQRYHKDLEREYFCRPNNFIYSSIQDMTFPAELRSAEKIIIILVPEHNAMSGGIYSFFSIANQMRRLKRLHGNEVVLMTRPTPEGSTYFRNTNFRNYENVYRFAQLPLCKEAKEIYLHIPEYASDSFVKNLSQEEREYIISRKNVHINILNQNIQLMPTRKAISVLEELSPNITQSVAHHAYFSQEIAEKYGLPTLLLPAYTDISSYPSSTFPAKEKLIIYSPDDAPHKEECLIEIKRNMPDFNLLEIRDITFDVFMEYATQCMFSISFGEGFDGYLAQPIHQGAIGFTVYNDEFFPSSHFKKYKNIFTTKEQMVSEICKRMKELSESEFDYINLNEEFRKEYRKLYSFENYVTQIEKLALRDFELFPQRSNFA